MEYVKFLRSDMISPYAEHLFGVGRTYALPSGVDPILCEQGFHVAHARKALEWVSDRAFAVEVIDTEGAVHDPDKGKSAFRAIHLTHEIETWNPRTQRLLACEFAERVAHFNPDPRVRAAIETARAYARGQASEEDLSAARSAAWSARSAESAAAESAARSAARSAEWSAEWSAAWSAAWSAESAARSRAERNYQNARLYEVLTGVNVPE